MVEFLLATSGLWVTLGLVLGGYLIGSARERRHLASLDDRERALRSKILVTQLETPPTSAFDSRLVLGHAVMASDYFKMLALSLRSLVGGEVHSYRPVMERARREALVRAISAAVDGGADQLVNVRFTTSMLTRTSVEVLCFGTAIRTRALR